MSLTLARALGGVLLSTFEPKARVSSHPKLCKYLALQHYMIDATSMAWRAELLSTEGLVVRDEAADRHDMTQADIRCQAVMVPICVLCRVSG